MNVASVVAVRRFVRISEHREHPFRSIVNTYFGVVNTHFGHREHSFRSREHPFRSW